MFIFTCLYLYVYIYMFIFICLYLYVLIFIFITGPVSGFSRYAMIYGLKKGTYITPYDQWTVCTYTSHILRTCYTIPSLLQFNFQFSFLFHKSVFIHFGTPFLFSFSFLTDSWRNPRECSTRTSSAHLSATRHGNWIC